MTPPMTPMTMEEIRAAIAQELRLARSGDGYEEDTVAQEIVDTRVRPLLATVDRLTSDLAAARAEIARLRDGWEAMP